MSEQSTANKPKQRRRYYNRNKSRNQKEKSPASETSSTSSRSSFTNQSSNTSSNNNNNNNRQRRPKLPLNPQDTRNEELNSLVYKLSSLKVFKLINSSSKQKIFRVDIDNFQHDTYKILIPIDKKMPISIQSIEETNHSSYVIRNFNNKAKTNDRSLLFYLNYLLNNYGNLSMSPNDYKYFEINKLL